MSVTWNYGGAGSLDVTIVSSVLGRSYLLGVNGGGTSIFVAGTGTGSDLTLTATGIGGTLGAGDQFVARVQSDDQPGYFAVNVFKFGSASLTGVGFPVTWAYDGALGVTASLTTSTSDPYTMQVFWYHGVGDPWSDAVSFSAGPGLITASYTLINSVVASSPLIAFVTDDFTGTFDAALSVAGRVFTQGVANSGVAGSPATGGTDIGAAARAAPVFSSFADGDQEGICIAFKDDASTLAPTWYRIDDPAKVDLVSSWSIDRGRSSELDKTKVGTATIDVVDRAGVLDPTNSSSPIGSLAFGASMDPMRQVSINLKHATSGLWYEVYRGFVDELNLSLDEAENVFKGEIDCVDALAVLARIEVVPDDTKSPGSGGTGAQVLVPTDSAGDVFYEDGAVDDRIRAALADANWPPLRSVVFSGNVHVQEAVYAVRDTILQIIQDAADAEFPGVSNVYVDRRGRIVFHGRLARFDPLTTWEGISVDLAVRNETWAWHHWKAGDSAAWTGDSAYVPIKTLELNRGMSFVINAALATPKLVSDSDIQGNVSIDAGSIATYYVNSASWQDLLTKDGETDGLDAVQETKLFSDYYKNNYGSPRSRLASITIGNVYPGHIRETKVWDLLCQVDIADLVTVKTTHPGGGGFNEDYSVEGVAYRVEPVGEDDYHLVLVTLDLSPQAYFTSNPFS